MGKKLMGLGLMTEIDRTALAMYCQSWARWVEAEQEIQENGVIVYTPKGHPIQNPYLAVANRAMTDIRRLLAEFGMTPASRSKVHVEKDADDGFFDY